MGGNKMIVAAFAAMALAVTANAAYAQNDCIARSAPEKRYGVTTFSANYLREKPDFTAELGNQALMGTVVEILDEEGYWLKVRTPDPYTAWCVDLGVKEMRADEVAEYVSEEKIICTADYGTVWDKVGNQVKICDIVAGDLLLYSGKTVNGYHEVRLPSGETGYVSAEDAEIFSLWSRKCDPSAENIISTAMRFIGVPYFWGGTSIKGVDCSGLTKMVWFLNGVLLPRNASMQACVGVPVGTDADTDRFPTDSLENFMDSPAFRDEMLHRISGLQPGDLIFFGTPARGSASVSSDQSETGREEGFRKEKITHVGIYIGRGRFIHASKMVRINSLIPGDPDFYELSGKMIKARRIIGSGAGDGVIRISDSPAYFPSDLTSAATVPEKRQEGH